MAKEAIQSGRVKGTTKFTFHSDYWRAIAKIAFHYYLLNSKRGLHGDEPDFADLRQFILCGGDHGKFFANPSTRFVTPFGVLPDGRARLPSRWAHFLAADESQNEAVGVVNLFVGPERLPHTHHVNLGRFRSPLIVPNAQFTHAYIYDRNYRANFAGFVSAGEVDRVA
jgi:hypothetical protein